VSHFMPTNVVPSKHSKTNLKTQMMKTTISQTSQSRDASLTSHKTAGG